MAANERFRWYIVNTYSGYEKQAKKSLQERIKAELNTRTNENFERFFGDLEKDIMIPTEEIVEVKKGNEKKTLEKKLYPGYMFIKMLLTDETWHLVKNTPKITGFVGNGAKPTPVPMKQIIEIKKMMEEGAIAPKTRIIFEIGENVKVTDGPFMNFNGIIDEVNPNKGKVRVMVSIFGRSAPVELDFSQVEKM